MNYHWGDNIGLSIGVPGMAPEDKYNVIILAFYISGSTPADAANLWANIDKYGTTKWGSGKDAI